MRITSRQLVLPSHTSFNTPLEMPLLIDRIVAIYDEMVTFNTPLEMQDQSPGSRVPRCRIELSILHWRCIKEVVIDLLTRLENDFQYSIGDVR